LRSIIQGFIGRSKRYRNQGAFGSGASEQLLGGGVAPGGLHAVPNDRCPPIGLGDRRLRIEFNMAATPGAGHLEETGFKGDGL
jgi:hypothetical protein